MDVIEAIRERKSIRAFKPTPIPKVVLEEIMDAAIQSPSAMNTQPWHLTVVMGKVLEELKKDNVAAFTSGQPWQSEIQSIPFQGVYRQRQVGLAIQIFKLMGIAREDKEKRTEWQKRGPCFFDAPAAIILTMEKSLSGSELSLLDMGALTQTLCLAAMKHGLGTCIEDQGTMYPQLVRKHAGIPESDRVIIGIAIGYPDWDFLANKLESTREPIEKVVSWVE